MLMLRNVLHTTWSEVLQIGQIEVKWQEFEHFHMDSAMYSRRTEMPAMFEE